MTVRTPLRSPLVLAEEAAGALIEKLGVAKAAEFWASLGYGTGDYTQARKRLFKHETVAGLAQKISRRR